MQAESQHSRLLSGWGRATWSVSEVILPEDCTQVEAAMVASRQRGVIARGLGRSYGDAALNSGGIVVSTTSLDALESDSVVVGAGVSLRRLLSLLLPRNLSIPVLPGTAHVTVGGAIAADVHGKNHHVDGAFSEHVISFRLVTPTGVLDVSRETDPDLFYATVGGMGLTGVIVDASLEMESVETGHVLTDTDRARDIAELMSLMSERDDEYKFSVAWLDCFSSGSGLGRGVLSRANFAPRNTIDASSSSHFQFGSARRPAVPELLPTGVLHPALVRIFNELKFRRTPRSERGRPARFVDFFHPLDIVDYWNRLYGRPGFVQYQFVVPFGEERIIERVLAAQLRMPSYLAVLKQMGPPSGGLLSFPIEGWTLALDFPVNYDGLGPMLDEFDRWVLEAGGKVYLAKDARMSPSVFREMYPSLERWGEIRERVDPEHVLVSDLARRLELEEC